MRRPAPLPDPPAVFTVRDAIAHGVSAWRLRGGDLHTPVRGVRSLAAPATVVERATAHQLTLPDHAAWARLTAASIWGIPLPGQLQQPSALELIVPSSHTRIRRAGCVGMRGAETRTLVMVGELRCTDLADTWVDLAAVPGIALDDLVIAGDDVARRVGLDAMRTALAGRRRPPGVGLLRAALELTRPGSRSPMETRSRLMFVRAGFPEPELNTPVTDSSGTWILTPDLLWEEHKVIGEYQGESHTDIDAMADDAGRRDLAEEEGYTVIDIFKRHVLAAGPRAHCLQMFARALGLDPARLNIH